MSGIGRRDFLRAVAAGPLIGSGAGRARSCILLVLNGGPSQVDTWDPKPDAPSTIRGAFRAIPTNVAGVRIAEIFPLMARHAEKYAIVRSVYGAGANGHEEALRVFDTVFGAGGAELPGPIGFMGGSMPAEREQPWSGTFTENCVRARQMVEAGAAFVRVNMFESVFHQASWDCHGARPFSTMRDYRDTVAPAFDLGYTTLLRQLDERGLLASTMVVAAGEFGRSPRINPSGGRDHWTKCRTVLLAGGGIQGGQVYGSSSADGGEPKDKPVSMEQLLATAGDAVGMRTGYAPVRELLT